MGRPGSKDVLTTVAINNQGLVDIVQAGVTGLEPKKAYVLATSMRPDGSGALTLIAHFMSNPAGAAIVDAVSPLRRPLTTDVDADRRYLVIAPEQSGNAGSVVQVSQ